MSKSIIIIGAGIAGIAASIRLALKGYNITIFESNPHPGEKLSTFSAAGYRFDAGPSLFTMPQFVEELFALAGKDPSRFGYRKLDVNAHYFYSDGTFVKAYADWNAFAAELERKLGEPRGNTLSALRHSAFLHETLADLFIHRPLNQLRTFVNSRAFRAYASLPKLDLFRTMHAANASRFSSEKAVQLFDRYATYNGSDPYQTPAIMNIIPHLEFGIGAFLPEKGMFQVTEDLHKLSEELGVTYRFNTRVSGIIVKNNIASGVTTADGVAHEADFVISNMDMVATYEYLLPVVSKPRFLLNQQKSSSALIFYWGIKKTFPQLDLHNILFSADYEREFEYIFKKKVIYSDPTVYVNVTSKYVPGDAPAGCENWFTMINVPCNEGQDWEQLIKNARQAILAKLSRALGCEIEPLIAVEAILDPRSIEERTSSWQGALYGNSSNNRYSAFLRHANKSRRIKNLFFCGGSVHPGGGIPLCLSSAKIVADYFPSR